ncbi:hypothetical protein OIU78_028805 [Salix suchowensis]|nr:hypothetical protein OIU78_028805 [Salix suchowensis]
MLIVKLFMLLVSSCQMVELEKSSNNQALLFVEDHDTAIKVSALN